MRTKIIHWMIKIKHNGAKGAKSTQFKTKQLLTRAVDQSRLNCGQTFKTMICLLHNYNSTKVGLLEFKAFKMVTGCSGPSEGLKIWVCQ